MRKFILRLVGIIYLLIALHDLAPGSVGFISDSPGYNMFMLAMAVLALWAADLGGDEGKWFDFAFSLVLIVLTFVASINFVYYGAGSLGNIVINGLSAIALLYLGLTVNHRLKHQTK